jgi:AcrR family transcriptional regulator
MYGYKFEGVSIDMRVRTEEKREEIIRIAAELFQENGFERTSMSMISERLGGSKATLYGYFKSKEQLLLAVVHQDVPEQSERLATEFAEGKDLRDSLVKLGVAYLSRLMSPTPIANMRTLSNQPEGSGMGKAFWDNILQPAWQRLANRIEDLMKAGELKRADPWLAAMQWKGLNELDMFDRRLLGVITGPDSKEIEKAATTAADAFLTLYGAKAKTRKAPRKRSRERS